jgi:hypothetical protein
MQPGAPQSWQDGSRVVVVRNGELPPLCVKCGDLGVEQVTRKLSWSSPWLLVLVLLAFLLYVLVAVIVAKRSRVTIWLCAKHAEARRRDKRIGWTGLGLVGLAFFLLLFGGLFIPRAVLGAVAIVELVLFLGGAVLGFYGYFRSRVVRPAKIDDLYIYLRGVSPAMRTALPQFAA